MKHFQLNLLLGLLPLALINFQLKPPTTRGGAKFEKSQLLDESRGDVVLGLKWKPSFLANSSQVFKSLNLIVEVLLINTWAYL